MGTSLDWTGYSKTLEQERLDEINSGRRCSGCGQLLLFPKGYRDQCCDCKSLMDKDDEVYHASKIRRPSCRYIMEASDIEDVYQEGTHIISCVACDLEFDVETEISYSFGSPALIKDDDEEEKDKTTSS